MSSQTVTNHTKRKIFLGIADNSNSWTSEQVEAECPGWRCTSITTERLWDRTLSRVTAIFANITEQ